PHPPRSTPFPYTTLFRSSLNLKAVISQRLVVGMDGKRMPATEVLINTPMIRDIIRRGQIHEIKEAMERSLEEGMQTFDQDLFRIDRKSTRLNSSHVKISY